MLDPALLDVVVVPGLAFTADGRRLGQGGGHFDRFLLRLRPDCLRIGVAFREQLVDDLPTVAARHRRRRRHHRLIGRSWSEVLGADAGDRWSKPQAASRRSLATLTI